MKKKGFTLVELLVVIAIIALLMGILMPALARVRQIAFRMVCGTNLSGIGKAMLIYANDYEDELPRAGGRNSLWNGPVQFAAATRQQAYNLQANGDGGAATITSCFYLLVKYAEVTPKSFLCKGDSGVSEFKPADYGVGNRELIDLWDFGETTADAVTHCSYSMHLPFDKYALTTSSDPGMAVAADRNPWMPGPFGDKTGDRANFLWSDRERMKNGNAMQHQDEGQNVLFLDSHVGFEKGPICGINEDNIWTYWDGGDIRQGTPTGVFQIPTVQGNRRQDSLLVTDGDGSGTTTGGGGTGGGGGGGTAR
jgi:prepilin-type N-terminal cleavage/methylation domain-containing protein